MSPPVREATEAEAAQVAETLRALVHQGATDDGFPWALAHGILAFGPELETSVGRLAVDALASWAERATVGGQTVYRFPPTTPEGLPVEPHADLIVSSLVAAGVPLDRELKVGDGTSLTVKALADDAAWSFLVPETPAGWHRFGWSAGLFFELYDAAESVPTQRGPVPVATLAREGLLRLEREQAFIAELMDADRPSALQKRRQGIYAHACGGLHFVQAAIRGAAVVGDPGLVRKARRQLDVLRFRWEAERALYRRTLAENPEYAPLLLVQELKFFGHLLETVALAAEWGVIEPNATDRRFFRWVTADLARTVEDLKPFYAAQGSLRRARAQTYYDLIGDGCHAIRALDLGGADFFEAGASTPLDPGGPSR